MTVPQDAVAALLPRLHDDGVEQLRLGWADVHGTWRSKTVVGGAAAFESALRNGVGMVSTLLLKDTSDHTAFNVFDPAAQPAMQALMALGPYGSANNVQLHADPDSYTVLPWAPHTASLRCEPRWPDGRVVGSDPRQVLLRAVDELRLHTGCELLCGLEVEFHIHRIRDSRQAAQDAAWPAEPPEVDLLHPGHALLSDAWGDQASEALDIARRTALGLGLPLRSLEVEFGPSQFEAVFAPTPALQAADNLLALRNGVRQALRRAGYHASFVCRPPLPGAVASGWHLHQSVVDAAGRNVCTQNSAEGAAPLSPFGMQWLAGLLQHAAGMTAIAAPTMPAYTRYQGSLMAPRAAVWGRDSRGALLRVLGSRGDPAARIENRMGEPLANPYLTIAAQIYAGLGGVQRGLQPPPETLTPYAEGHTPLPATLAQALDALRDDAVLQRGLGPEMGVVYDTIKRHEVARHAQAADVQQWERREYFSRY